MDCKQALSRLISPGDSVGAERQSLPAVLQVFPTSTGKADRVASYADLQQLIEQAAAALAVLGIRPEASVLMCSPNTPELVALVLACWRQGLLAIPVDFRLTDGEVNNIAQRMKVAAVYAPGKSIEGGIPLLSSEKWAVEKSAKVPEPAVQEDKPALVILTSGTTGVPKGAVHDLRSLVNNIVEIGATVQLGQDKTMLLPLPVSHVFGLEVTLAALVYGGAVCFADFIPAEFAAVIERTKPSMVVGVPTIYGALVAMPVGKSLFENSDMAFCGGAPLPASLAEEFHKKFGKRIIQGYGTTETKIISVNADGPVESIGRPVPSTRIEIVDNNEKVLPEGETGELRISGPTLMMGYLNQPEATADVLHAGHYHTGDIGHIKDGYVFISGRSKEMIIVAGNKIFPSEVEDVLRQNPLAAEVAVVGVAHSRLGQLVKAIIVVPPGEYSDKLTGSDPAQVKATRDELESKFRESAKNNLKRELRPMAYEFRPSSDPLPKTHTGKIDKKQLVPA
jgi:long-chain acyl-CoA synthetase